MQARTPRGGEVFSTDTALTSSNSLHVSHLLQLAGPHSAELGTTAQLLIGWMDGSHLHWQVCGPHHSYELPLQCSCCTDPQQTGRWHRTRGAYKGWGGCTEKRKVFSWWLPARSTLTCGSRQLLNHLSFQSTLTRSLWIMVWTFQIRTIFLKVFYWVTHLVHFLFRLYQCSAGVCFDFLACSNAACSFLENCTSKILHTQQWLQSTYWKINTEPQIS